MNYYEKLEVSPKASPEVIKAAYKSLMQRYHPDRNPDDAEAAAHASLVIQAYEVLSDATKRAAYDIELERQSPVRISDIRGKSRDVLANTALVVKDKDSSWLAWLLIASIIFIGWLFLSSSKKQQSSEAEMKERPELLKKETVGRAKDAAARTIPVYIADMTVNLKATEPTLEAAKHELTIPTLGVIVGTFDPDKFIEHIESNNEYISQKLAAKLADAHYEELIKTDGERYLKKFILDSLGEITGTNRFEDFPSTGEGGPRHYGVVDVLLPESFAVQ